MRAAKILFGFFLLVLFTYVTVFTLIEHRRLTHGPWFVTFHTNSLVIDEHQLGITNVLIRFPTPLVTTNTLPEEVRFDTIKPFPYPVPGGECVFQDLISQPGNLTLKLNGHVIQMLPVNLNVDGTNHDWHSGLVIELGAPPSGSTTNGSR